MKALILSAASASALMLVTSYPAAGQTPAAPAPVAAAASLSVEKTPISALWANPAAKAILLKELPSIGDYMDQIKDMTLAQVAPVSEGKLDDAKLKAIQAELDALK